MAMHGHFKRVCNQIRAKHVPKHLPEESQSLDCVQDAYTALVVVSGVKNDNNIGSNTTANVFLIPGFYAEIKKLTNIRSKKGPPYWMASLCHLHATAELLDSTEDYALQMASTNMNGSPYEAGLDLTIKFTKKGDDVTALLFHKDSMDATVGNLTLQDILDKVCPSHAFFPLSILVID